MGGAANFPTSLDDDTSLIDVTDGVSTLQAAHHNNMKEAIKAIENKVGIRNTSIATALDTRLGHPTMGHVHDGASGQGQQINATAVVGLATHAAIAHAGFKYRSTATQAIPNAAWTPIQFGVTDWDSPVFKVGATGAQVPSGYEGKFDLAAMVEYQSSPSGSRYIRLNQNGNIIAIEGNKAADAANHRLSTDTEVQATVGDLFNFEVWQNSGATLVSIPMATYAPQFRGRRTGA